MKKDRKGRLLASMEEKEGRRRGRSAAGREHSMEEEEGRRGRSAAGREHSMEKEEKGGVLLAGNTVWRRKKGEGCCWLASSSVTGKNTAWGRRRRRKRWRVLVY